MAKVLMDTSSFFGRREVKSRRSPREGQLTPKSEEFQTFERGLRKVLSVSKKDLDAEVERTKEARANGNGKPH